jgi:hypothetical protein
MGFFAISNLLKYVAVAALTLAPLAGPWIGAIAKDLSREGGNDDKAKYEKLVKQIAKAKTKEEVVNELKDQIDFKKLKKKLGIDDAKDSDEAVKWVVEFFASLLMNKDIKAELSGDVTVSVKSDEKNGTVVFIQGHDKATVCKILVSKDGKVYDVEAANFSALKFFGDNAGAASKKPLFSLTKDERCDTYIKFSKEISAKGAKGIDESLSKSGTKNSGAKK